MQQDDLKKDFFVFLGLPVAFDLDPEALEANYRTLQKRLHPDRFSSSTDQERRMAVQMSAHLNEAHATLVDPMRRGRYLLGLQGVNTDEETDTVMSPEFLMEQMEVREQLEAIEGMANPWEPLDKVAVDIQQKLDQRMQLLSTAFGQQDFETARGIVREMQFLQKIQHEIEQVEERLA